MDVGWTIYQELVSASEMGICIEHRIKNGLSVDSVLAIDCMSQCPIYRTCPLGIHAG